MALSASAQATGVDVRWRSPASCPAPADLNGLVQARLRGTPPPPDLRADVTLRRAADDGYLVSLRLSGAVRAGRKLRAESCQAAVDAVSVLIALAIDPSANVAPAASLPATAPAPVVSADRASDDTPPVAETEDDDDEDAEAGPPATREPDTRATPAPQEPEATADAAEVPASDNAKSPLALRLWVGAGAELGTLPALSPGAELGAGLASGPWLLALHATWLAAVEQESAAARVELGSLSLTIEGCHRFGNTLVFGPCLGAELGLLSASATGLVDNQPQRQGVVQARAGLIGEAALAPGLLGVLWVSMGVPIWYPRWVIEGAGEIHRPASPSARMLLMLGWVFG